MMKTTIAVIIFCVIACTASAMLYTPSLRLWLPLDEPSGTSAADQSGGGYTGTLSGTYSRVAGVTGTAVSFNAPSTKVDCGTTVPTITGDLTLAAWVNPKGTALSGNRVGVISRRGGTDATASFNMDTAGGTGKIRFILGNGTTSIALTSTGTITYNTWYHIASTISGTLMSIYINSSLSGTAAFTGTRQASAAYAVGIGTVYTADANWGNYSFQGAIDSPMVYSVALPISDIKRIMYGLHPLSK